MEFGELLKQYLIDLQRLFRAEIVENDLTLSQILLIASIPDQGVDMTSLAQQLGVDNSTLTRLTDVLIKRGWSEKTKAEDDKRIVIIQLTQSGQEIQDKIELKIDQTGDKIYESIASEEREEVKEILSSFQWHLSKHITRIDKHA